MIYNNLVKKDHWKHEHLMSGYYLHCIDEKYSKPVQLFDSLEKFRDNRRIRLTRMKLRVTLHRVSCSYINVATIIRGST